MSIWNRAPVEAVLYERVDVDDGYGSTVPGLGPGHPLKVFAQQISDGTGSDDNWGAPVMMKLYSDTNPCDRWSEVHMDGDVWTVVQQPKWRRNSSRTQHFVATIEKRGG